MSMTIRPETPGDYAAIADVNVRAFDQRAAEAVIVDLHRHRAEFDPELSLVAEVDGRIAGHVLFSPRMIRLLGQDVRAVNLAPIAVDPDYQRRGIGGALIEEGYRVARAKGYTISFLLGHVEYYPRFGYKTGVYGSSSLTTTLTQVDTRLEWRKPVEADVEELRALWRREEGEVDFAIDPGGALIDWLSPNPAIEARVYTRNSEVVGYARVHQAASASPRLFLAGDDEAARAMAAQIGAGAPVTLPLHPYSRSAGAFDAQSTVQAWDAGMACSLSPGVFDEFYERLKRGERLPGRAIWPAEFDVA